MKILVTHEKIHDKALKLLKEKGFELTYDKKELESCDVFLVRTYDNVNKELLDKAKNLKAVIRCGVGLDNLDLEECKKRGINVFNSPGSNSVSVAEHTVLLMLACLRKLTLIHNLVKSGEWKRDEVAGDELMGKTVGILGFGNIGRLVAERLSSFKANLISYDSNIDMEKAKELNVKPVELNELIKNSDVITLHIPLLDSTRDLINSERISQMKDGVVIINTARGGIINQKDLINALKSGKISFAGIDVFEPEPPEKDNPLLKLKNVVLTSHIGAITKQAFERMCIYAVENFINSL